MGLSTVAPATLGAKVGLVHRSSGATSGSEGGTNYNHWMPRTAPPAAVALTSDKPGSVDTDLLFVPAFEGESLAGAVTGLDEASGGAVREAGERGEFRGRAFELFVTPAQRLEGADASRSSAPERPSDFDTERLRKVATAAALAARHPSREADRVPQPRRRGAGRRGAGDHRRA